MLHHARRLSLLILFALLLGSALFTPGTARASVSLSGSWYDPTHDGEGFIVQFFSETQAVVYWFTYDEDGGQRWFIGLGTKSGNRLVIDALEITEGGVFGAGFDKDAIERIDVGELTLTFDDDASGVADYVIDGVAGQQNIIRITRPVEVVGPVAANVPDKSGSWYDPNRDGEGFVIEILPNGQQLVYWFTYNLAGGQAWMLSLGEGSAAQGSFQLDLQQPVGGRFGPDFDPADVDRTPAGAARLGLACTGAFVDFVATDRVDFENVGFGLQRIVGIGPGSCVDPEVTNLYPVVNGAVAVPDHEAGRQLSWLLDRFAESSPFTDAEISERFSAAFLAGTNFDAVRDFLEGSRNLVPSPRLTDPVGMAPMQMTGLITGQNGREAFFVLNVGLSDGKIDSLSISDFGTGQGTVVRASDRALNLEQAADRFASLYAQQGLLVARVDGAGACQPVVERDAMTPRSTASIFKIWILAGVADALAEGDLFHDQVVPLDGSKQVQGGQLFAEPPGIDLSIDRLATLMMGISDNTATDMLLGLAGRDRIDGLHAEYGHATPTLLAPQLGISEQFHLFFSFPFAESLSYVNGTETFQRQFLEDRIVPLGSSATGGGGFFNESLFIDGAWRASAMDICGAFARHRQHPPGTDEALVVDRALQAQAAQPNVRERWDRVWYKGGSLASGANGLLVLTHAWLLEREGEAPVVVVGLSNEPTGNIDQFDVQSILGRILELAADL
jgi:hypothetical protein